MRINLDSMNTTNVEPAADPLAELRCNATVSVPTAGRCLGISRTYAYALARDGRLPVVRLGPGRVVVKSAALLRMIEGDGD